MGLLCVSDYKIRIDFTLEAYIYLHMINHIHVSSHYDKYSLSRPPMIRIRDQVAQILAFTCTQAKRFFGLLILHLTKT